MRSDIRFRGMFLFTVVGILLIAMAGAGLVFARERDRDVKELPERAMSMAVEFPGIVVSPGEDVNMDVIFENGGRTGETVMVNVREVPGNWDARIKNYQYEITRLYVPSDDRKTLTFEAISKEGVEEGDYEFVIEANTPDKRFEMSETVVLTVRSKEEKMADTKGVKLTTSYPVLRGPTDSDFEFSLDVESRLKEDAVFDLFGKGPDGWEVNFKPAYESKYFSSLRIKAGQSSTVAVEVKPPMDAKPGEYNIDVRVTSGEARAEADLTVILTGTFQMEVGTVSDLLSMDARQGKPANMSVYVKNTGSATQNEVSFMSFKPENWKVEFQPEKLQVLEPGALKQAEVVITPYEEALVGDYSVSVKVNGEKVSEDMEFRVTVKASSAWAWIGIGIIVLVIAGLTAMFSKLGRR